MNVLVIILIVIGLFAVFWFLRQRLESGPVNPTDTAPKSNPQTTVASPVNNPTQSVLADKSIAISKVAETPADAAPYLINANNIAINDQPTVSDAKRDELAIPIAATPVGTSAFTEPVARDYESARANMATGYKVHEDVAQAFAKRELSFFQVTTTSRGGEQTTRVAATDIGADPRNVVGYRRLKTPQGDVLVPISKDDTKVLPVDVSRLIIQGVSAKSPATLISRVPSASNATVTVDQQNAAGMQVADVNRSLGGAAPVAKAMPSQSVVTKNTQTDNSDVISRVLNSIQGLFPKVNQQKAQLVTS